jgi:hypothetical protein
LIEKESKNIENVHPAGMLEIFLFLGRGAVESHRHGLLSLTLAFYLPNSIR